ncbi:MAG: tetratricopeptide repeat protein, partial [Anaerolineae bacterium]|nr:tetratricopeptide repeat protein [Anaerolineae bacterium]
MVDDAVFQEAVDALRQDDKAHARELLTGLIKSNQNNPTYWIWLSAAMESSKERIYCLQTALKLDPENAAAKRGLVLLGALPADETIQPFPINRPRAWEEKLLLAHEKPKPKGWAAVKASPVFRLGLVVLLVGAIASGVTFGFIIPAANRNTSRPTFTPGPSPTYTLTVTAIGGKPQTEVPGTPAGPLAELLEVPYTPTPLYVQMQRSPLTSDYLLQFERAYKAGNWDQAIEALENVVRAEPDTATAYYYMGEAYRFKRDPGSAINAYNNAINKDPNFGPAYVGLARARLLSDPNSNVLPLLDEAVRLDPEFGEAYLERGRVKSRDNDIQGAIVDLGEANRRLPDSPLVFYYLAQTRLKEGELQLALDAAQRSNELDVTYLPSYLLLGQIYAEAKDYEEAVDALNLYLKYEPNDLSTYLLLGKIEFDLGNYSESIQAMNRVIANDRNRREPYLYRFLANIELGNGEAADEDLDRALAFYPDLFEANLGLVRAHLLNGRNGSALVDLDKTLSLAETDAQKSLGYYWAAIVHERREELEKAADYWQLLLDLPEETMTAEMRITAQEHLLDIWTPTPT